MKSIPYHRNLYKPKLYLTNMNKWIEILFGLVLIIGAILVAWYSQQWCGDFWNFKHAAWEFLKGGLFWFIALIGLLFLMLGISDLKE